MKIDVSDRAYRDGQMAVARYLGRVVRTGIGCGLDVLRCANPFDRPAYRAAWLAGFDSAVRVAGLAVPDDAPLRERLAREGAAARRVLRVAA